MRAPTAALFSLGLLACGPPEGGGIYDVLVQQATVGLRDENNACWEPDCTAPSTYVCITTNTLRRCTTRLELETPQWFETLFRSVPATTLQSAFIVEMLRGSGAPGDASLCRVNALISNPILITGRFNLQCTLSVVLTVGLPRSP